MGKAKRGTRDAQRLALAITSWADVDYKDPARRSARLRIASRQGFHAGMAERASILLDAGPHPRNRQTMGKLWAFRWFGSSPARHPPGALRLPWPCAKASVWPILGRSMARPR